MQAKGSADGVFIQDEETDAEVAPMMLPTAARIGLLGVLCFALLVPVKSAPGAQQPLHAISGVTYFDENGNGHRDANEPLLTGVQILVRGLGGSTPLSTSQVLSQEGGAYGSTVLPGTYSLQAVLDIPEFLSGVPGGTAVLTSSPRTVVVTDADQQGVDFALVLPPTPRDPRFFTQTGYRIDDDLIWRYFQARGGVATFGFPVSRTFPFLGYWTQLFQRQAIQVGGQGGDAARPMNLLDPGLLPIRSANFSALPPYDVGLARQAPSPYAPGYAAAVIAFVRQHAPDTWEGLPVGFYRAFTGTVSLRTAYPTGGGDTSLLPLLNLEVWGVPTSQPAFDPANHRFVFLRFQRGIMHYDAGCNCTQGILLGDLLMEVVY